MQYKNAGLFQPMFGSNTETQPLGLIFLSTHTHTHTALCLVSFKYVFSLFQFSLIAHIRLQDVC